MLSEALERQFWAHPVPIEQMGELSLGRVTSQGPGLQRPHPDPLPPCSLWQMFPWGLWKRSSPLFKIKASRSFPPKPLS